METLHRNGIPQPAYSIINGAAGVTSECYPCWIKKANGWSTHKDDICYAQNSNEATRAIEQMEQRGIKEFILMQHCTGDIVKFYGIADRLFHHVYPTGGKFGHEEINGAPRYYAFDTAALENIAQRAARAIGLEIYGGDAIITPQGEILIIDINDFPSFTAVREAAAAEIAQLIISKTEQTE
jgi:glutathione synthase/RimK-type ligase-like ATP-grasp enzyme